MTDTIVAEQRQRQRQKQSECQLDRRYSNPATCRAQLLFAKKQQLWAYCRLGRWPEARTNSMAPCGV